MQIGLGLNLSVPAALGKAGKPARTAPTWTGSTLMRGLAWPFAPAYTSNVSHFETWQTGPVDYVEAFATGPTEAGLLANMDAEITSLAPSGRVIYWSIGIPDNKTMADVVSGSLDAMFASALNKIATNAAGRPTRLRPFWEAQNAGIGSWAITDQSDAQANTYKAGFRRFGDQVYAHASASIFFIDFCINETTQVAGSAYDPRRLDPGSPYRTFMGQDLYWQTGTDAAAAWRLKQNDTYGLNFWWSYAKSQGCLFTIPEYGVWQDNPLFLSLMHQFAVRRNICMLGYFNADNGGGLNNRLDLDAMPKNSARFKLLFANAMSLNNLVSQGDDITIAPWSGNGINSYVSGLPDYKGGTSNQAILETTANAVHLVQSSDLTVSATSGTFQIIATIKPHGRTWAEVIIGHNFFGAAAVMYVDLTNGIPGNNTYVYGPDGPHTPTGFAYAVVPEGDGSVTAFIEFNSVAGYTQMQPQIRSASADGTDTFAGDITKGIEITEVYVRRIADYSPVYSTEASAVFAAFTTPPTSARKDLIDACISGLKADGVWSKLTSLQVYAAADSQAACVDWANVSRAATLTGAPTFTADRGFTTNGTSSYIDTLVNPTTSVGSNGTTAAMAQSSMCAGFWSLTSGQLASSCYGFLNGTAGITIAPRSTTDTAVFRTNTFTSIAVAGQTDGTGFWLADRSGSAASTLDRNGAQINSNGGTVAAVQNLTIKIGNVGGSFLAVQSPCHVAGSHLTATQRTALNNRLRTYMTAVGVP